MATLRRSWSLPLGLAVLLLVSALAALTTAVVLEIQAGATAYIVGEGHWSKGRQEAVHHLHLYSQTGDVAHLRQARQGMAIPLGDRIGRLALESSPPDLESAHAGFLQGGNDPDDVGRLIWMFQWFAEYPFFRDAVRIWRDAEQHILRLDALADSIERSITSAGPDDPLLIPKRAEILAIAATLRPMEIAFSETLVRGARWLRMMLLLASVAAFMLLATVASLIVGRSMRQIRETESNFRAAFQQARVGMAKLDVQGGFVEVNDALCRILARPREALVTMRLHDLIDQPTGATTEISAVGLLGGDYGQPVDRQVMRGDCSLRWLRWTVSLINGTGRRPDRLLAVVEDVSEARELVNEIAHQASHDALTGLINRREIERRLQRSLDSARRLDTRHALCFLDLDQFKLVNDTCGHAAGDDLLRRLGQDLQARLRSSDALGRLGGDEFAIVLDHTSLDAAMHVGEKLRDAIERCEFQWKGRRLRISGSIGVVEINHQTPDLNWLLAAADTACYMAKDEGRNRVRVYRETDIAIARRRGEMELAGDIRQVIADQRLRLFAQEIQCLSGAASGLRYELLARPLDNHGNIQPPGAFLAAAERYQLAETVDRAVLSIALEALARNPGHLAALELCHINVSAQSVASTEFRRHLDHLLDHSPVPAHKLCFELTETAAIGNLVRSRIFIQSLHERGCLVALDDFGSGPSSFGYLKNLPVDMLKIDGAFIRDSAHDPVDRAMLGAIRQLAKDLGMPTIAECVESAAVKAHLIEIGIEYGQGFSLHRPCPFEELLARASESDSGNSLDTGT